MAGAAEWALFLVLAFVVLAGAAMVIVTMSMYRAGLFLMLSFVALGGLFVMLDAQLLAAMQIMMNVGGMLVMILFMVMLMMDPGGEMMWDMKRQMRLPGLAAFSMSMPRPKPSAAPVQHDTHAQAREQAEHGDDHGMSVNAHHQMMVDMAMSTEQLPLALIAGPLVAAALALLVGITQWPVIRAPVRGEASAAVGELLLTRYMIAFEGAAMLILAGIAGGVILGRRERRDQTPRPAEPASEASDQPPEVEADVTHSEEETMDTSAKQEGKGTWTCPMHPEVRASAPGKCPKCGMALVQAGSKQPGEEKRPR